MADTLKGTGSAVRFIFHWLWLVLPVTIWGMFLKVQVLHLPVADPIPVASQGELGKWIIISILAMVFWLGLQFFHLNSEKASVDGLKFNCVLSIFLGFLTVGVSVYLWTKGVLEYGYLVPLGASIASALFSPMVALSTLARRFTPPNGH